MLNPKVHKKKITFLISTLGGGGAERVCVILANGLASIGWLVDVVVVQDLKSSKKESLSENVNFICLNAKRARYAPIKLLKYLRDSQPDVVLTMNNEVAIAEYISNLFVPRLYTLVHRSVTTLSSVVSQCGGGRRALLCYWFIKKVLMNVDCIVNQCLGMAKDTLEELNIEKIKNLKIYNPVSSSCKGISLITEKTSNYILAVGRLDKNKSFHLAIDGLAALPTEYSSVELWIAGDGPLRQKLLALAEKLNVGHRVKFLGFCQDVKTLYENAGLVSLTSEFEGFPNILLEAIAYGTPIVSVDCPNGPSEIVVEGVNGFLVQERSAEALAMAYAKGLNTEWNNSQVCQTAERFSEQHILQQWDQLLKSFLENQKANNV